jgi:Golgi nucleoside diphosphatase
MIEISTLETNSLTNKKAESNLLAEDLGEDEQSFYSSIKPDLNSLTNNPAEKTISSILDYSKSL